MQADCGGKAGNGAVQGAVEAVMGHSAVVKSGKGPCAGCLELGTRGSKIGKHWFERLGTSSSSNGEPVVLRLGRVGSNVWEPAVSLLLRPICTA